MIRLKVLVLVWCAGAVAGVSSQPCHEDGTCFDGHFCDPQADYSCRPCLSCNQLKREDPPLKSECVKSVLDCGPCLKDLVPSRAGDLSCVERTPAVHGSGAAEADGDNGTALWILAAVLIAVFVVAAVAIVRYMFKNTNIFKMHLNTNIETTLPTHLASAPEAPPPYSPHYQNSDERQTELPLIKQYQPPFPEIETHDTQTAFGYNPPSYVRVPQPEGNNNVPADYGPMHDEDTSPSPWQPGNANHNVNIPEESVSTVSVRQPDAAANLSINTSTNLSAALAVARNTSIVQPPQNTHMMITEIGNDSGSSSDEPHAHEQPSRTQRDGNSNYNIMNVNQIFVMKPSV